MSAVQITGVSKTFAGRPPVAALRSVDLTIERGSLVAIVGPSGCGKTTLLRVIAGFERPDTGRIEIDGAVVAGPGQLVPPHRRGVGLVPQEGALFPHLSVAGNIGFGLRRAGRAARARRVAELLELVDLGGLGPRRPHELSGGQQQRVALARALAAEPRIVLLDEPFTALDPSLRAEVRHQVAAVLRSAGTTAVLVTHDPMEALAVADVVAAMGSGRIAQVGPGPELYERPLDRAVASLLGPIVELPATVAAGVASTAFGPMAVAPGSNPPDGRCVLLLRPEQILRDDEGSVEAEVVRCEYRGHDVLVALVAGDRRATARWPSTARPSPGERCRVRLAGWPVIDRSTAPAPPSR